MLFSDFAHSQVCIFLFVHLIIEKIFFQLKAKWGANWKNKKRCNILALNKFLLKRHTCRTAIIRVFMSTIFDFFLLNSLLHAACSQKCLYLFIRIILNTEIFLTLGCWQVRQINIKFSIAHKLLKCMIGKIEYFLAELYKWVGYYM